MGWINKGAYTVAGTKAKISRKQHQVKNNSNQSFQVEQLMTREQLAAIERAISAEGFNLLNGYRKQQHLAAAKWNQALQKAGNIRAKEILVNYNHVRPYAGDPLLTPFEYGYSRENKVEREAIGKVTSDSLKWLIHHGAKTALEVLVDSIDNFLIDDLSDEQALGVYIEENRTDYTMGFVYFGGRVDGKLLEARAQEEQIRKVKLAESQRREAELKETISEKMQQIESLPEMQKRSRRSPIGRAVALPKAVQVATGDKVPEAAITPDKQSEALEPENAADLTETLVMDAGEVRAALSKLVTEKAKPLEQTQPLALKPKRNKKSAMYEAPRSEKATPAKAELRQKIAALYDATNELDEFSYQPESWGKLMLAKSDAMMSYRDQTATADELAQVFRSLNHELHHLEK